MIHNSIKQTKQRKKLHTDNEKKNCKAFFCLIFNQKSTFENNFSHIFLYDIYFIVLISTLFDALKPIERSEKNCWRISLEQL
jgi:hypothetical protein